MAITQDVVVLNDFGSMRVEERQRTTSSGTTSRYTVTMTAEPILHDFTQAKVSRVVPNAIAALLRKQITEIQVKAAESTIIRRIYNANAYARGVPSVVNRYSGGRTGEMLPEAASYDRIFNDSGRLAKSIAVMQNVEEEGFTINVAANRLNPATFPGGSFTRMIDRLRTLVPALKGGIEVLQDPAVKEAVETAKAEWIVNAAKAGVKANSTAWALIKKFGWQYGVKPILLG